MAKNFKVVNLVDQRSISKTDWNLCAICQEVKAEEALTCPLQNTRVDKGSGYSSLAEYLTKFNELGQLPSMFTLGRLDEGQGIEAAMVANKAKAAILVTFLKKSII